MCGICGQFIYDRTRAADPATVQAMARAIAHRGPDDEGYHFNGPVGLGFRRLSIIDLAGGHQPMSDTDEQFWVVFNGEIYNFPELRDELEALGHVFRTRSDTEVIVHGYAEWGDGVLERMNGMFGLAIWDERRQRLVLARDPFGIKPIYYSVADGTLLFGSEMRAVLAAMPRKPALDPQAVNLFLRYRYTPAPWTLYEGIHKMAPGTKAVFENGRMEVLRWYGHAPRMLPEHVDPREATEQLLAIYKRSLERHLLADVPVGLLLSGGVDSGLLLALMNLYGKDWQTYTVGYGQAAFKDDELLDAQATARLYGARHHGVLIDRAGFEADLERVVGALEEPIASSSIVPMYHVCARARQDVKVALIGQGPDELFGGYTRHLGVRYGIGWRGAPEWLRSGAGAAVGMLPRSAALKRGIAALGESDRLQRYRNVFSLMPGAQVDALFRDGVLAPERRDRIDRVFEDLRPWFGDSDELGGFQLLELRSSLPDELLMFADKLSMAHGLEARVPYLDREVVEFAQGLPQSLKVRMGRRKWLHRQVCRDFLAPEILARKKRGFAVNVVDDWLRGSMQDRLGGVLNDEQSLIYGTLEPAAVRRLMDEHKAGRHDHHKTLFSLVVLEQWMRSQSPGRPAPTPLEDAPPSGRLAVAAAG